MIDNFPTELRRGKSDLDATQLRHRRGMENTQHMNGVAAPISAAPRKKSSGENRKKGGKHRLPNIGVIPISTPVLPVFS